MSEGSVQIKELVKTYTDDRGRPTFTAVKQVTVQLNLDKVNLFDSATENVIR